MIMQSQTNIEPAMTAREVAQRWSISPTTVYAMMEAGDLPFMSFGVKKGAKRIRPEDVKAYEQKCLKQNTDSQGQTLTESGASSGTQYGQRVVGVVGRQVASATKKAP